MSATPRPWSCHPCSSGGVILRRGGVSRGDHPQTHLQIVPAEDGEFIVRAVNAHDALVAALINLLAAVDRAALGKSPLWLKPARDDARAALKLAESQP